MIFSRYSTITKIIKVSFGIAAVSILTACSDEDSSTPPPAPTYETGIFIDAPVSNINYETTSNNGTTNAAGEFTYLPGEKITFFIDGLALPEVLASNIITPIDMAKAMSDDADIQSSILVNIARLLQTLDTDNNPQNGIDIPSELTIDSTIEFTLSTEGFEAALLSAMPNKALVDTATALAHIKSELTKLGIDVAVIDHYVIEDDGETGGGETGGGETGGGETGGGETGGGEANAPIALTSLPVNITNKDSFVTPITLTGELQKLVTLDVTIEKNYANLSLLSGDTLLIDNVDIPATGSHTLQVLVNFPKTGNQNLTFIGRSADITLNGVTISHASHQVASFKDISAEIGLATEDTFKYGGPAVGDVNNDGHYDFVLANHNFIPPQLVTNNGDNSVSIERLLPNSQDFHGNALGDYDNDGDLDIMVALGGANGTSPTSYTLLKNNDGIFEDVSIDAGINTPARGRSPRWADFDQDGDLDLMLANAKTPNNDGPIQLFYRNMGDGTFTAVRVAGVESQNSERLLITDFNGDQIDDIILYSPLSIWRGNGNFSFTDVSATMLPANVNNAWGINAIADTDVNNDGNVDLYLAFGKTHYQLSRKSIDFNPTNGQLNIRDDGETGTTLIDFTAPGDLTLSELNLTYRQYNGNFPIFLGADKSRKVVKAEGFQPTQLPAEMASADDSLLISQTSAEGWPDTRKDNGLYIGHTGDGNWKAEWVRDQNIYWNVSFTLDTLTDVNYDWVANNRNGQDMLLINEGDKFIDATTDWALPKGGDHWGVTHGDFNNDGWNDLFVYRYGFLQERVSDLLLLNTGNNGFITTHMHGAFDSTDNGHGDMGQAFDFNKDGAVDMLSGSEESGHWYLWENSTTNNNHYLLVDVGYSPLNNVDSSSAQIIVTLDSGNVFKKRVGSAGEVFSAGLIDTVHFGLGQTSHVASVQVKWRNGESVTLLDISANTIVTTDNASNPTPQSISLGDSSVKLRTTTSLQLAPSFVPLNAIDGLDWVSSDTNIASVDVNGLVMANNSGVATITATSTIDSTLSVEVDVQVGDFEIIPVQAIEISGGDQLFYEGLQVQLATELTPLDADNKDVSWSSDNDAIATINDNGLVSSISAGNAVITATAEGSASDEVVSDSLEISVEQLAVQALGFDDESKYQADIPVSNMLEVTANYHAGSGQVVNDAGIKFYVRELTAEWVPVNDMIIDELTSAGTSSGSVSVFFDISDLPLTKDLADGHFYFLFVKFTNDKGQAINKGLSPLSLVAGLPVTGNTCDLSTNLLCGNTDGESAELSEWYAYAKGDFVTDLSSQISVSNAQSNGGNSSIKYTFNTAGAERHIILKEASFEVDSESSYQLNVDVLGANLSAGNDYVIEISMRPAGEPENAETYKLWHKKSAEQWHSLTMTQTLPVGNYIVGFKVFGPGFSSSLALDYYLDNIVVTKL